MNMVADSLNSLILTYRAGAEGTAAADPKTANKHQRQMHAAYKKLRVAQDGRVAISALMSDPSAHVRCWAAAHALEWNVEAAKSALLSLQNSGGPCSFDAEMTLEAFNKGQLSFEY